MITIPPLQSYSEIRTKLIPDITKTWTTGQVLNAIVENDVNINDKLFMRMGNYLLETKTPIPLKTGDQLKLLVSSTGESPVLKIILPTDSAEIAAQNLKNYIARQLDITQLLQLTRNIIENPYIPKTLKQLLVQLNQMLPSAEQLTQAKSLKKMIRDSGVFLEAKLNTQPAEQNYPPGEDIKSQLLKISAQLQTTAPELAARPQLTDINNARIADNLVQQYINGQLDPIRFATLLTNQLSESRIQSLLLALNTADNSLLPKELHGVFTNLFNYVHSQARPKQLLDTLTNLFKTLGLLRELKSDVDGALAKITSQQLTSLTREPDSPLLLLFDLILKDSTENHLFQFRLEQETQGNENNEPQWIVSLNFDFEELGPVQAQLHLTDNDLSTVFHAERETTVNHIVKELGLLETAFRNIGFTNIKLDAACGGFTQPRNLPRDIHLLDETV